MASKRDRARSVLVTESPAMQAVVERVESIASSACPVLIEGEPGAGRELIARILHYSGPRADAEIVVVEAGAAPKEVFSCAICDESSAIARARGGMLVVKDVGALSPAAQRKLVGIVSTAGPDDGSDVRVVATCDAGLDPAAEAGVFDAGLYSLLGSETIVVPPLRERVTDIAPLAARLVAEYAREIGRRRLSVSTRAYDRLVHYPWPGNVAELKQVVRRLVIRAKRRIEASDVDAVLPVIAARVPAEEVSLEDMVRQKVGDFLRRTDGYPVSNLHEEVVLRVEKPLLDLVMEHTGGNQVKAAEILGLNRNTLRRKLGEHGLRGHAAPSRSAVRVAKAQPARTTRRSRAGAKGKSSK